MPGTLYHIFFGKCVHEKLSSCGIDLDLPKFMSGNLLPDLARNKNIAHHYPKSSNTFFVPDLDAAKKHYSRIGDTSIRLGIFAHLWLDKFFTENLIAKKFELKSAMNGDKYIKKNTPPYTTWWSLDAFFSFDGIYRAYSECNPMILKHENISMEWIKENVPYEIPPTSFSTLDNRIDDNWLDLLERRLEKPPEHTGELLSFKEMVNLIKDSVDDFVDFARHEIFRLPKSERIKLSPVISIPGKWEFSAYWDTLREGITETVLGNPNISPELRSIVEDFVITSCKLYQSYCEARQGDKSLYLDVPNFINDVAYNGLSYYGQKLETSHILILRKLFMDLSYPRNLNFVLSSLTSAPDHSTQTNKEWVAPLTDILKALIAADGNLYRLVVSYSTF